jgi:hypothetical protein
MKGGSAATGVISGLITLLALADGLLHLMLDFILFHGTFWGQPHMGPPGGSSGPPPSPPPGAAAPPQFPLPLNELFVLNCIGFMALVVAFWITRRWLAGLAWLVNVALILMSAASIGGWFYVGEPNPQGLGYLSKIIEVALIVLLLVHAVRLSRPAIRLGST